MLDEGWKGDETGARQFLERMKSDLGAMTVAEFCQEYGIGLGS